MTDRQHGDASIAQQQPTYTITRRARHWEVRDPAGELVCLTVYKRGAQEVVRRMSSFLGVARIEVRTTRS